jgi:hypothetical protein
MAAIFRLRQYDVGQGESVQHAAADGSLPAARQVRFVKSRHAVLHGSARIVSRQA